MAALSAQGEHPEHKWQRTLPENETVILGRDLQSWAAIPWDPVVSRHHAELTWENGKLRVHRIATAKNPVLVDGREVNDFELKPGESFTIGRTVLTLHRTDEDSSPDNQALVQSRAVGATELENIPYRDARHGIDVLSQLPNVIASAANDTELLEQLIRLLLAGIPRADAIAVVAIDPGDAGSTSTSGETLPVKVLDWEGRHAAVTALRPSHRLVREALVKQRSTVLHVWAPGVPTQSQLYTLQGNYDWAFCTPLTGDACQGWGLYVAGKLPSDRTRTLLAPWSSHDLGDDLKLAGLVAALVSSLRQSQMLQRRQALLSQFFSPVMLPVLTGADPQTALKPRQTEVTVLLCDLRGFARKVELASADLFAVLERVSKALGVMTQNILAYKGVIADFQGDAAMAFWGWPQEWPDRVALACRAALGIRTMFETVAQNRDHPLTGFQVGIGIATGRAVAGQIGTTDQAKVTVFGPVVNLASRLEGMTKLFRVPILLDETTARLAVQQLPVETARCRQLALVKPYGLESPVMVSELLPAASPTSLLTSEDLIYYSTALDAFLKGDWAAAYDRLHLVPPQDRGKDLLLGFILKHDHTPPSGWNGVIPLESK